MSERKLPAPNWCNRALQGLVYWIGHRRAMFDGHHLTEGALVAETCNLIYTSLHDDEDLLCEVQYSKLLPERLPDCFGKKSMADLVIVGASNGDQAKESLDYASAVIEVKRASVWSKDIDKDIRRLAALKAEKPNVRAFLFLVSEAKLPDRFVSNNGTAKLGKHRIEGINSHYCVRRVCKAAHSFRKKEFAHYACVIEVFN